VYRASFQYSLKELKAPRGEYRLIIPVVLVGCVVGVGVGYFLSKTSKG